MLDKTKVEEVYDSVEQLIAEGVIVAKEFCEYRVDVDVKTGEERPIKSYFKRYYDTRKFIKTFNPIIDKLIKDFEGNPKAQFIFILMSLLEENINNVDVDFIYSNFCKICDKHEVKHWTRSQLSNCLSDMVKNGYIAKVEKSIYRINYRYFYNGNILKPLGLTGSIPQYKNLL